MENHHNMMSNYEIEILIICALMLYIVVLQELHNHYLLYTYMLYAKSYVLAGLSCLPAFFLIFRPLWLTPKPVDRLCAFVF